MRCERCGFAYTDPRLGPTELENHYPPSYPCYRPPDRGRAELLRRATAWVDRLRLEHPLRRGSYRSLASLPAGRLLDVGCGRGALGEVFRRRGWEVAGVEPSPDAASQAAARGIEVHRGDLSDAPWPPGSFDAVIFNHSLEHIPEPVQALERARRLLRLGGLLGVSVPNFACWQRRVFRSRWFQLDLPRHLHHFDRNALTLAVSRAGLRPLEVHTGSMLAGLTGSLQYALFGRLVLRGLPGVVAAYATAPLLALLDRVADGDCLAVVARRED
jgi:SAM-dependent methyltransferase